MTRYAGDVADVTALAAHQMVVVVADSGLVSRPVPRELDPPDHPDAVQRGQAIVDSLGGQTAELDARPRRNSRHGEVSLPRSGPIKHPQNGKTRPGHP
jgi:hypothetical protein